MGTLHSPAAGVQEEAGGGDSMSEGGRHTCGFCGNTVPGQLVAYKGREERGASRVAIGREEQSSREVQPGGQVRRQGT